MIVGISVLFIVRDLQLPPVLLGAITGAAGPAALAGAVLASRLVRRCGAGTTLIGAAAVGGMAALLVPLAQGDLSVVSRCSSPGASWAGRRRRWVASSTSRRSSRLCRPICKDG